MHASSKVTLSCIIIRSKALGILGGPADLEVLSDEGVLGDGHALQTAIEEHVLHELDEVCSTVDLLRNLQANV